MTHDAGITVTVRSRDPMVDELIALRGEVVILRERAERAERHDVRRLLRCPECGDVEDIEAWYSGQWWWKCHKCGSTGEKRQTRMDAILAWHGVEP